MRLPLPSSPELRATLARAGERPVVVFDGDCVACSAGARFVIRRDRSDRLRLTTAQSEAGTALYRALGLSAGLDGTMLLVEPGGVLTESDAVLGVAAHLGQPWRLGAAALRLVPAGARDRVYAWIARNRFRWFGRRQTCWMPDARDRDRIL